MFSKKEDPISDKKVSIFPLQQIFYGAPGTGKSHTINEQTKGESVIRTTFHPDSDYSTFVGAYKPTTKSVELRDVSGHKIIEEGKEVKEDRIVYEFVAQAFLQAYILAWKSYSQPTDEGVVKPQYLVIEEINRGNCAQIFGDIFQLLDRDDNGFSKYEITSDADLQKYIADQNLAVSGVCDSHGKDISDKINSGELLKLPNNFYIWATMNTSDQSLFPIDSAFKRRWDWKYVPIDINKENWTIKTATKEYSWSSFLQKINDEIDDTTHSEDKMLGFYFCKADDGVISSEKFVGKVLFYVYNDVFKDYGFSREMFKGDDGKIISFHSYYNSDGSIDENKVEKFLDNLIQNENSTIPSEENIEQ
ncbi:MAG: AAA family ATPase [Paludibacteraceae bacterium]|nr:AAA family ATPase [Paludibacteraceae bacterium]